MTRTIVAILALTPGMLLAQAKSPAQPSSTPVLQSALLQPAAFAAIKASNNNPAASNTSARISTGVVAPKLVHQVSLPANSYRMTSAENTVVIRMVVDEKGTPTQLQVERSADPILDQEVLQAVSQFHYRPGTLNGEPVAVPVKLEYKLEPGTAY
jgi:TonB family protein